MNDLIKPLLLSSVCCWFFSSALAQQAEYGLAVYYADYLHGRETALGEYYDKYELTCAHKTYSLGTLLRVTRLDNNRSVTVRVNDRGPYTPGRVVDLSWAAAQTIDLVHDGMAQVKVEPVGYSTTNPPSSYRPEAMSAPVAKQAQPAQPAQTRKAVPEEYDAPVIVPNIPGMPVIRNTPPPTYPDRPAEPALQTDVRRMPSGVVGYSVQIASYTSYDNAVRKIALYQEQGLGDLYLRESKGPQGAKLYRVLVGIYNDRPSAERQLSQLRRDFQLSGFVYNLSD